MNFAENIVLITFDRNNATGPYGVNPHDRRNVYLDNRCGIKVQLGDRWFCTLVLNSNLMASNYFATPICKVDPTFLYMLDEQSKKEIAEYLCESHPDVLKETVADKSHAPTDETNGEEKMIGEPVQQIPQVIVKKVLAERPSLKDKVWYLGENRLGSSLFKEGRYSVCQSFNGRRLQVCPDRFGNIECRNNEIAIGGLDEMMGYEPRELEFDPVRGMVLITV